MANKTLVGDDWSTAADWDGAAKPVDNDVAIIPGTNGNNIVMTGDEGGVDLDALDVHRLFKNRVGSSATPIAIAADLIKVYGSAGFYFECDHDGLADHFVDECVIQMPTNATPVELGSVAQGGGFDAKWKQIMLNRGMATLKSNIVYDTGAIVEVGYVNRRDSDAKLTIASGGPTLPNLRVNGGRVENNSVATDAWLTGGTLVQDLAAATSLYIYAGGVCEYNHTSSTLIVVYGGGTLNLLKNAKVKTITTLWTFPGSKLIYDPTLHTFTTHKDFGGEKIIGTPS